MKKKVNLWFAFFYYRAIQLSFCQAHKIKIPPLNEGIFEYDLN